jgi:hypothetical protein
MTGLFDADGYFTLSFITSSKYRKSVAVPCRFE